MNRFHEFISYEGGGGGGGNGDGGDQMLLKYEFMVQ